MSRDIFKLSYKVKMLADSPDTAEMRLYGEIVEDGPEWWKWSKEDKSAADFQKEIDKIKESGAKKLKLRINSPGGVCTQSVAMRSILSDANFESVDIVIEGLCASAATDIATIPGAHVAITEGSEYMIHDPWCMAIGNANELEHTIERLRGIEDMSRGFYVKRTGQTDEQIKEWMDNETWFTAKQAVEYGFADEVLEAKVNAVACVSSKAMTTMKKLYASVPEQITEEKEVVNATPVTAGVLNEIQNEEDNPMEIKDLTMDQLRDGNPALLEEIRQSAVAAERDRLADIDALTVPGYEEMAAQAKANGTSAMDFQKQIVAAMKEKGSNFLQQRTAETAPAQEVTGGEPVGNTLTEEQQIEQNAKDLAEIAKSLKGVSDNGMF